MHILSHWSSLDTIGITSIYQFRLDQLNMMIIPTSWIVVRILKAFVSGLQFFVHHVGVSVRLGSGTMAGFGDTCDILGVATMIHHLCDKGAEVDNTIHNRNYQSPVTRHEEHNGAL